ncbi:RnfABCDGE type electron transport complex subunit D [bacterium]|nr:RnfABCDGE type electron transport complex subunit D [bacterium]
MSEDGIAKTPTAAPLLVMSSSPHVHSDREVPRIMRDVLIALAPALLMGLWFFGLPALRVLVFAVGGCLCFEWATLRLLKRPGRLHDLSAAVTGVLLAMNLPPTSPWWLVLIGAFVAIVIAKQIYGGLGYNPFNPALVARVLLLVSFPVQMTTWALPTGPLRLDGGTGPTPLGTLREGLALGRSVDELALTPLWKLLVGVRGGSLGEVSVIALLLGGLYLLWRGHIRWQIPVGFLAAVAVLSGLPWLLDPARHGSPVYHLLSGGLFLGAFFMATDMVTSPVTRRGMLVFGLGCGLLTALIRLWGGYPEGVSFAILLMNAATPLIDRATRPRVFGTGRRLYEERKAA